MLNFRKGEGKAKSDGDGVVKNTILTKKFLHMCKIEKNLSPRTIKAYRCDLKGVCGFFEESPLLAATIEILREYLASLEQSDLAPASIRRKLATLKVFFGYLEEEEMIPISPARKLRKRYRIPKRLPRVMSSESVKNMLTAVHGSTPDSIDSTGSTFKRFKRLRDRAILEVLFSTGIRIDELSKLSLNDIDFDRRTVLIQGKGGKERVIYLSSDEVVEVLKRYIAGRDWLSPTTNALFLNRFGRRLSVHSIGPIFREYRTKAGVAPRFTPHCFRHTMATMLLENGADVRSVQEILGHSRICTTEIYLEVSKHRKRDVLRRFNQRNNFTVRAHSALNPG